MPTDYKIKSFRLFVDGKEYHIGIKTGLFKVKVVSVSKPTEIKHIYQPIGFDFVSTSDITWKQFFYLLWLDIKRIVRNTGFRRWLKR